MRVLVFGTFDELHPGHSFLLTEAGKRGEVSIVVARDENVLRLKGHAPMQTELERKASLERSFPHAEVLLGDPEEFLKPVKKVRPDLILLGYDQKLPPGVQEADLSCPVERLPAFHPERYKSSLRRHPG